MKATSIGVPDVFVGSDGYLLLRHPGPAPAGSSPIAWSRFGVDPAAIFERNGYVISEVGKPPEFVLEVASESTGRAGLHRQARSLLAEYGVAEYWRFDRSGGRYHDPAAVRRPAGQGAVRATPAGTLARTGVTRGYSPVLGLELHWDTGMLRFYDPVVGDYLPDLRQAEAQREMPRRRPAPLLKPNGMSPSPWWSVLREQLRRLQSD